MFIMTKKTFISLLKAVSYVATAIAGWLANGFV